MNRAAAIAVPVVLLRASCVAAAGPERGAEATAADFIAAFNALDEARFDRFWSERATAFLPSDRGSGTVRRLDGRAEVLCAFHTLFAEIRHSRPGPPYLQIDPKDLRADRYGDTAVITFHLDNGGSLSRRTLVMRRDGSEWRIVHLHASNMTEVR